MSFWQRIFGKRVNIRSRSKHNCVAKYCPECHIDHCSCVTCKEIASREAKAQKYRSAKAMKPKTRINSNMNIIEHVGDGNLDKRRGTKPNTHKLPKESVECKASPNRDAITDLLQIAVNATAGYSSRREAIRRLGEIGDSRAIESLMNIYNTELHQIRLDAFHAVGRIKAKGKPKLKPVQPKSCSYRYKDSPDKQCNRVPEPRARSGLCVIHMRKTRDAMDKLCMELRDADYEALESRIIDSVKNQLDRGDFDFAGASFYAVCPDERNNYFTDRTFVSDVSFCQSHFCCVKFVNCVFKGKSTFRDAVFEGYLRTPVFINCTFEGFVNFQATKFVCGGGGFENVQFLDGADFSGSDFQYKLRSYDIPEINFVGSWSIDDVGTIFRDVISPKPLLFEGARGVWGIASNSTIVTEAISNAPFHTMPPKHKSMDFQNLNLALKELLCALRERECISADEAREMHREECIRDECQVPLRRFDQPALEAKMKQFFDSPEFSAYQINFAAPRVIEMVGFREESCVAIRVLRDHKDVLYAFGHMAF